MELSALKTQYTFWGSRQRNSFDLRVHGVPLKETTTPKVLGYTLQPNKGSFTHVREMLNVLRLKLAKIRAIGSPEWGPSRETIRAFYLALIQSKLLYGCAAWWSSTSDSDVLGMENLHCRAAHVIAGVPGTANRMDVVKKARL